MHIHVYLDLSIMASSCHKDALMKGRPSDRSHSSCFGIHSKPSPESLRKESTSNGHATQKCKLFLNSTTERGPRSDSTLSCPTYSSPPACKPAYSSRSKTELELRRSPAVVLEPENKRVGSLEDSPKWSRIKEAFEGSGSHHSLNKTFSRSTSSLPRPLTKQLTVASVKRTESCDRNTYFKARRCGSEAVGADYKKSDDFSPRISKRYSSDLKSNVTYSDKATDTRQMLISAGSGSSSVSDCSDIKSKKTHVTKGEPVAQEATSLHFCHNLEVVSPRRRTYCSKIDDLPRMSSGTDSLKQSRRGNSRSKTADYEQKFELRKLSKMDRDDTLLSKEKSPEKESRKFPTLHKSLPNMESINSLKLYLKEIQDSKLQRQKFLNSNSISKESCSLNFSLSSQDLCIKSSKPKFTDCLDLKLVRTSKSSRDYDPFHANTESRLDWKKRTAKSHGKKVEDQDFSKLKIKKKHSSDLDATSITVMTCSSSEEPVVSKLDWDIKSSNESSFCFCPKLHNSAASAKPQSSVSPLSDKANGLVKLERELTFHGSLTSSKSNLPGWKMTSSGSWIKVTLEKDLPIPSVKSKVALLAHQFDHLRSSGVENTRKDIVVYKNKEHCDEPDLSCQTLDSICCPVFTSDRVQQDGESITNHAFNETVITKESMQLGLVKQAVQNFEENTHKVSPTDIESSPVSTKSDVIVQKNFTNASCAKASEKDFREDKKSYCNNFKLNSAGTRTQRHSKSDVKLHSSDDINKSYSTFTGKSRLPSNHKLTISPCLPTLRNSPSLTKRNVCHRPLVPPPRRPAKCNSPVIGKNSSLHQEGESSLLAELEMWLVQKYDQKDQQERQPNDSFLWKKVASLADSEESNRNFDSKELSPGYYSKPFVHSTNVEEHIYMEACVPPTNINGVCNASRTSCVPVSSCDSDEGWVDVDDPEVEQAVHEARGRDAEIHSKIRSRNVKAHCVRRSWIQSVRDKSTNEEQWAHEDYKDISVWEPEEENASSSSSTNSDHLYEALYDEIIPDEHDINLMVASQENLSSTSYVGESRDSRFQCEKELGASDVQTPVTVVERNDQEPDKEWALPKSNIHLELASNFDRMKVRKGSQNITNTSELQSDPEVVTSKKRTLIRFMLRQKNNPTVKTHAHKKGATFYVRWSKIDRETRERNVQAEERPCFGEEYNHVSSVKRQPSNCVRRPTIPPPLPPAARGQVRSHEGSKSLEIFRSSSNDVPLKEKAMSLDSTQNVQLYSGSRETLCRSDSFTNRSSNSSSQGSCSPSSSHSSHDTPIGSVFLMTPKSRESVASSLSSHSGNSYIHEDEVASIPKPTSLSIQIAENECDYLQLRKDHNEALRSPFEEEPLYQFYNKGVKERATKLQTLVMTDEDQDETMGKNDEATMKNSSLTSSSTYSMSSGIPSAMQLLHHDIGNQRTLWCEVPEVRTSGLLSRITVQERKLQEAMFEVITSEASYLKSLTVLIEHFMKCPEFSDDFSMSCVLGRRERHVLFSDVIPVQEVSARLLNDLEHRWQESILISNICDILYEHASKFFSVYVKYCANQVYQDRILKEMKATRPDFISVLQRLESNPVCQGLDMHSFLMLPMQRITRMPLLVDAIFHRLATDSPFYDICKLTLVTLNKVVAECNEAARKMERMEEMLVISRQLDFKDCKSIPLISASRWLVKKGELVRLVCENNSRNKTFGRSTRYNKIPLYFFLFTDLLLIAKKKSEDMFVVQDYCPRNLVQVFTLEAAGVTMTGKVPETHKNIFQLTMLQNHEFKTIEMILGCPLESDRTRWMEAVTPPISENPEEKIYEEWDCPQVQCIYPYKAKQPDELTLEESDVVNVFRKMPDGWHEGERLRDGIKGWFPASFTVEIISSHIRARNLRQRYRLLMLSQAYVEEQRKAFLLDKSDRSK